MLIALTKNTAIAGAFGVIEATGTFDNLMRDYPAARSGRSFLGIAAGYVLIVLGRLGACCGWSSGAAVVLR